MIETLRFLFSQIWPKNNFSIKIRVVLTGLCLILAKVFSACTPLSFKWLVNGLLQKETFSYLMMVVILYAITRVMNQVFSEFRDALFSKVTQKVIRDLGLRVFKHLHTLDLEFHLSRQTGGLNRVLDRGIKGIESFFRFSLFNLLPTFIEILFVFVILWVAYGFIYGFVALFSVAIYIIYTFGITKYLIGYAREINETDAKANTRLIDSLLNYETVKYFNNEELEARRFDDSLKLYQKTAIKRDVFGSFLNAGQSLIVASGLCVMLWLATKDVLAGHMTLGDLVLINTFLIQLYIPLFMLGFSYREIKNALVAMEGMFSFLKLKPKIQDAHHALPLNFTKAEITFDHIFFSYQEEREILKDVSFVIKGGKTLGIVGETGSGKSTIAKLSFRFFDLNKGIISIDGQNIQNVTQESLRRAIGVVPQDTVLFNDTIFYNILYGNPDASKEEVYSAAQNAEIHDFIISLPQGYDTVVGERGLRLSGGEKQRVAIARVLLKNPRIFIFDEATSALDTVTEKAIQHNLLKISKGFTTLIIAHRLSTVQHADQIIVLDDGHIVENGTHEKLLKLNKRYARLWSEQSGQD